MEKAANWQPFFIELLMTQVAIFEKYKKMETAFN